MSLEAKDKVTITVYDDKGEAIQVFSGFSKIEFVDGGKVTTLYTEEEVKLPQKKVICINSPSDSSFFTLGKEYEVISENKDVYELRGDNGETKMAFKDRFRDTDKVKRIVCIDDSAYRSQLTKGKEYIVVDEQPMVTFIISDRGRIHGFYKNRFKTSPIKETIEPGDIVEVVEEVTFSCLTKGKAYEVSEVNGDRLVVNNDAYINGDYPSSRFKLKYKKDFFNMGYVKQGDIVKVVDSHSALLTAGKGYEVLGVASNGDFITVTNDLGVLTSYHATRFKLYKKKEDIKEEVKMLTAETRTYYYATKFGIKEFTVDNIKEVRAESDGSHTLTTLDGRQEIMSPGWLRITIE